MKTELIKKMFNILKMGVQDWMRNNNKRKGEQKAAIAAGGFNKRFTVKSTSRGSSSTLT